MLAALIAALVALLLWTPDIDRATLEAKYLRAPSDLLDVAGMRLDVRDEGPRDAPVVLLIHGFGSSLETWDAWVPSLAATHRVVRFDLPGSGLSDPDPTGRYDDARTVDVVVALLDRLGIARATVVGHSLGGRIAWTFAAAHPERVERLVLMAPDGFALPGLPYGEAPKVGIVGRTLQFVTPKPLVRSVLARAFANPAALSDALVTRYDDLLRAPGARAVWIARWRQSVRLDPVPRLATIEAPTLVVWGTDDHVIPFGGATAFVDAIPGATLVAMPGVGHIPQEEAPAASLAIVEGFIAR